MTLLTIHGLMIPQTDQDHGLCAVFYSNTHARTVLCGYMNRPHHMVHAGRPHAVQWEAGNGKIQAAASCPTRPEYKS
jgi:hypothetical protein